MINYVTNVRGQDVVGSLHHSFVQTSHAYRYVCKCTVYDFYKNIEYFHGKNFEMKEFRQIVKIQFAIFSIFDIFKKAKNRFLHKNKVQKIFFAHFSSLKKTYFCHLKKIKWGANCQNWTLCSYVSITTKRLVAASFPNNKARDSEKCSTKRRTTTTVCGHFDNFWSRDLWIVTWNEQSYSKTSPLLPTCDRNYLLLLSHYGCNCIF